MGCSGLIVSPERSATGGTLYGRNCDFPFKDVIEEYSLVIVYRPTGRKAFAMVTFPGVLASNCGMNQDGLTLGANTATKSGDGAPAFNPDGMPYSVAAREVMETCGSVDDFDRWIRGHTRTEPGAAAGLRPEEAAGLRNHHEEHRRPRARRRAGLLHEPLPACPDGRAEHEVPPL